MLSTMSSALGCWRLGSPWMLMAARPALCARACPLIHSLTCSPGLPQLTLCSDALER